MRTRPRVAVNYELAVRLGERVGRGETENVSDIGAMISVQLEPPPEAGEVLALVVDIPALGAIEVEAVVRWVSTVLPGMVGVEFEQPVPTALAVHVEGLLARAS
nr:PilZ domain-containing protein [Pseudenhygromyxa sp. WMMC2535]